MTRFRTICAASIVAIGLHTVSANAAETCIGAVEGVQVAIDTAGSMGLYIYSREIMAQAGNGNTYLYYSGDTDILKSFHAQFLVAKAGGHRVCISYQPGTPSYRWMLSAVAVADPDGWPFE